MSDLFISTTTTIMVPFQTSLRHFRYLNHPISDILQQYLTLFDKLQQLQHFFDTGKVGTMLWWSLAGTWLSCFSLQLCVKKHFNFYLPIFFLIPTYFCHFPTFCDCISDVGKVGVMSGGSFTITSIWLACPLNLTIFSIFMSYSRRPAWENEKM